MKNRWVFKIYNGLLLVALPFILLGVMARWRRRMARGLERWPERWGHLSAQQKERFASGSWWWVHAVSLGEVKAIEVFLKDARKQPGVRVLLSLVTPEALAWAKEKELADEIIAAPIDLPWVVRRAFVTAKPKLFISVESEFWPNLLREAKRSGARVALVNGRVSAHSYESYKSIVWIMSALWENFDLMAVRQHEDASRFTDLGVPQRIVHVTGNLKYDLPLPGRTNGTSSAHDQPLTIVVGSSREGEEKELLNVMEKLKVRVPRLRVIWAPRHVDRINELETLFTGRSVPYARKSLNPSAATDILWDTMGDLLDAYKQADVAVVGGSFVPKGGQNPIEPAALSVPVVFGPSMENFHGIAEVLVQQGGARQVTLTELERCLGELLENKDKREEMGRCARRAVESRQGATDKTLTLLKDLARA